jgi:hypothetical protein
MMSETVRYNKREALERFCLSPVVLIAVYVSFYGAEIKS